MRECSIRLRLTMWYSAVLLLGFAAFGLAMWVVLEQRLIAGVDSVLEQRVQGLKTTIEVESSLPRDQLQIELAEFAREIHEGELIQLRDDTGIVLLPVVQARGWPVFSAGDTDRQTVSRDGRSYRLLHSSFHFGGRRYDALVASDLQSIHALIEDCRFFLLLTVPAVLGVAALGGHWISGRALAPVDEITSVARSITVQNLSKRLSVPRTGDELQRMSETWNEMLDRLENAVARIRQFTADASHELRTPVALIRTTAELALRRERNLTQYQESLRVIQTEAERMTELTDCLLTLARADSNGVAMHLEPTDINAVVASSVAQTQHAAAERGITLCPETLADPPFALANGPALRRLLLILIENALTYTPSGGEVRVVAENTGAAVRLTVSDTGEGIPREAASHIFERFYRADPARASGSGVGLGLSIAQSIARAHDSTITVESEPGKGARFALVLQVVSSTQGESYDPLVHSSNRIAGRVRSM